MNNRILKKCKSVADAEGFFNNTLEKTNQTYLEAELH